MANKTYRIDDTKFMWTNLKGDPAKDKNFGSNTRKCSIEITDPEMISEMTADGIVVYETKPGEKDDPNDYVPDHYVYAQLKYRDKFGNKQQYPPRVYLVNLSGEVIPYDEDMVGDIDDMSVKNVNVILSAWLNPHGTVTLYIRTMYVEQKYAPDNDPNFDYDPYGEMYKKRRGE